MTASQVICMEGGTQLSGYVDGLLHLHTENTIDYWRGRKSPTSHKCSYPPSQLSIDD